MYAAIDVRRGFIIIAGYDAMHDIVCYRYQPSTSVSGKVIKLVKEY